jgi:hypothetical protein
MRGQYVFDHDVTLFYWSSLLRKAAKSRTSPEAIVVAEPAVGGDMDTTKGQQSRERKRLGVK